MRTRLAAGEGGAPDALVEAGIRLADANVERLAAMVALFHDCGALEEATPPGKPPVWRVHADKLASVRLPVTAEATVSMRVAALTPKEQLLLERAAAMARAFWFGAFVALERAAGKPPSYWDLDESDELPAIMALLGSLCQREYLVRMS